MALYPKLHTTAKGRDLIGRSNANSKGIVYKKAVVGDGEFSGNIDTLFNVVRPKLEIPFNSGKNLNNGQWQLSFVLDNKSVNSGFYAREIGIFAKMEGEDDSNIILFAYTNGGNYVDYIPDKSSPIDAQIINADIVVGDATNIIVEVSKGTYLTFQDLHNHNTDENSHEPLLNKWINKSFTKFREAVVSVVKESIVNILQITYSFGSTSFIKFGLFNGFTIQCGSQGGSIVFPTKFDNNVLAVLAIDSGGAYASMGVSSVTQTGATIRGRDVSSTSTYYESPAAYWVAIGY